MRPEELGRALAGDVSGLWFITGEEPLLMIEAADAIRARARRDGYLEREVLSASANWDWGLVAEACQGMSLFSEKKIIELRLATPKPGVKGAEMLTWLADQPLDDLVVIVSCPSDWTVRKLKWFQALSKSPRRVVDCQPVTADRLPGWLGGRLAGQGLKADPEALSLLAERCEGNLLAARQEVLKLALLHDRGTPVTADDIRSAVSDVSRFDADNLLDAAMTGDGAKALRIVESLRGEGVTIPGFAWMLADDIRLACQVRTLTDAGRPVRDALRSARVFGEDRGRRISAAARRLSARRLANALSRCADIDRISKGLTVRNRDADPWMEIRALVSLLAR